MKMQHIPFATTDWASVPREEESAKAGQVVRRMVQFGYARVRRMGLKPGYMPGMRYQVADNVETHRSRSQQAPPCSSWTEMLQTKRQHSPFFDNDFATVAAQAATRRRRE